MEGAHDMGGVAWSGPVLSEPDEPMFHAEWERRAFAITLVSPQWPYAAVIALCVACGASAFGWNGVYIAEVARITSGENVALATGAVITFNFLGIVIAPVLFWLMVLVSGSYTPAFVLIGVVTLAGSLPYFRKAST